MRKTIFLFTLLFISFNHIYAQNIKAIFQMSVFHPSPRDPAGKTYFRYRYTTSDITFKINNNVSQLNKVYDFKNTPSALTLNISLKATYTFTYEEFTNPGVSLGYTTRKVTADSTFNVLISFSGSSVNYSKNFQKINNNYSSWGFHIDAFKYKKDFAGNNSTYCSSETVSLNCYNGHPKYIWQVQINETGAFTTIQETSNNSTSFRAQAIANAIGHQLKPGDKVRFRANLGYSNFPASAYPLSTNKYYYPTPAAENAIDTIPPKCFGGNNAQLIIGSIEGNSPTHYRYSVAKYERYTGGGKKCPDDSPFYILSGKKHCPNAESGTVTPLTNPAQNTLVLEPANQGGLMGMPAGLWRIAVEQKDFTGVDKNYCSDIFFRHIHNPPQATLDTVIIPEYTYGEDTFNITKYAGESNIQFHYSNGNENKKISLNGSTTAIGENLANIPLNAGNYTINSITDQYNCPFEIPAHLQQFTLKQPAPFNIKDTSSFAVDCNWADAGEHQNGKAEITVEGGLGPYSFRFNHAAPVTTTDANLIESEMFSKAFSNYSTGFYPVNIETLGGEELNFNVYIPQPDSLKINFSDITPPVCLGGKNGSVVLEGIGGNLGTYKEEHFTSSHTGAGKANENPNKVKFTKLTANKHSFTITDDKGCNKSYPVSIPDTPGFAYLSITDTSHISCTEYDDGRITIKGFSGNPGNGNYNFYLDFENYSSPGEIKTGNNITFTGLTPNTHSIHIDDASECLNPNSDNYGDPKRYEYTVLIEEPELINVNTTGKPVSQKDLSNGEISIEISGGQHKYNYKVENEEGEQIINGKVRIEQGENWVNINLTGLTAQKYRIYIQDTCQCSNSTEEKGDFWMLYEVDIEEPKSALSFDYTMTPVTCHSLSNGRVELEGTGGWKGNGYLYGMSLDNMSETAIFEGLDAGKHKFFIKDDMGVIYSDSIEVTQPNPFSISVKEFGNVKCHNGNSGYINLEASGGSSPFRFSKDNSTWNTSPDITDLSTGDYTIWAYDKNNCPAFIEQNITQPAPLAVSFNIQDAHCTFNDGSITAIPSGGVGGYNYEWKLEETTIDQDSILNDKGTGRYKFKLTDSNNCTLNSLPSIGSVNGPKINITGTDSVSCNNLADGSVTFSITEGTANYNAEVINSSNEPIQSIACEPGVSYTINQIPAGKYTLWVTDAANCPESEDFYIYEPHPVKLQLLNLQNPVCFGDANATITVEATGGNKGYNYTWSNSTTGSTIENITEGNYTVTVTDKKNCSFSETYSITNPEPLQVSLGEDAYLCEGQEHTLSLQGYSTYQWYKNGIKAGNKASLSINSKGDFSVWVQDEKGCNAYDTIHIEISDDLLEADFLMPSEAYENDTVVAIDISWPDPEQVYWSFDKGINVLEKEDFLQTFTFDKPGMYHVALTSVKALCIDSLKKVINVLADTTGLNSNIKLGKESNIKTFKVFPNPNTGIFSTEVELKENKAIQVSLYGMQQGNYILKQDMRGQKKYRLNYNFSNLTPGIYHFSIIVENERKTEKILIID